MIHAVGVRRRRLSLIEYDLKKVVSADVAFFVPEALKKFLPCVTICTVNLTILMAVGVCDVDASR